MAKRGGQSVAQITLTVQTIPAPVVPPITPAYVGELNYDVNGGRLQIDRVGLRFTRDYTLLGTTPWRDIQTVWVQRGQPTTLGGILFWILVGLAFNVWAAFWIGDRLFGTYLVVETRDECLFFFLKSTGLEEASVALDSFMKTMGRR